MWYTHPLFSIALGGILPFGAVCIELFFIMSALWLHQIYYVFGTSVQTSSGRLACRMLGHLHVSPSGILQMRTGALVQSLKRPRCLPRKLVVSAY
jgi:hypothetical protein